VHEMIFRNFFHSLHTGVWRHTTAFCQTF